MVVLFAIWTLGCFTAAINRHPLIWVALWLPPLAYVTWDWLHPPGNDEFGIYPRLDHIAFISILLVVAVSGIVLFQRMRRSV